MRDSYQWAGVWLTILGFVDKYLLFFWPKNAINGKLFEKEMKADLCIVYDMVKKSKYIFVEPRKPFTKKKQLSFQRLLGKRKCKRGQSYG